MSIFAKLNTAPAGPIQEERDSLGGSRILDSDAYDFTIEMAYVTIAKTEATGVVFHLKDEKTGAELRSTQWITSGKEKGGKNTYTDSKGNVHYLAGWNITNAITKMTIGKELHEVEPEKKQVKLWNSELKKEVPTEVEVLVDLIGKPITLGILRTLENKTEQNQVTKKWDIVPGEKENNEVDKVFRTEDRLTVAEDKAQVTESAFYDAWVAKNKGNVRNKMKPVPAGAGSAGLPKGAGGAPTKSLFGGA